MSTSDDKREAGQLGAAFARAFSKVLNAAVNHQPLEMIDVYELGAAFAGLSENYEYTANFSAFMNGWVSGFVTTSTPKQITASE